MDKVSSTFYNTRFFQKLRTSDGMNKMAFAIGDYVATKVREDSFLDKILPAETVNPTELQGNVDNDTLYALCELEPEDVTSLVLNVDGEPTGHYFSGPRFEVPFWVNTSRRFEKASRELLAYKMTIKDIVERNAVSQLVTLQDTQFLAQCDAAIAESGKAVTQAGGELNRDGLVDLINELDGDELECDVILMRKDTWNDILRWESANVDIGAWETIKNGYTERTLMGRKVIVSVKNVITADTVYAFTSPKFIGKHYVIEDTRAELKEEFGLLQFEVQKFFGFNIGNVESIARLTITA